MMVEATPVPFKTPFIMYRSPAARETDCPVILQPNAVELFTAAVQVNAVFAGLQVPLEGVQLCTVRVYPVVVCEVEKLANMLVNVMARAAMFLEAANVLEEPFVLILNAADDVVKD